MNSKNLRKLKNANLLVVTSDANDDVVCNICSDFKDTKTASNPVEAIAKLNNPHINTDGSISHIDIILIDTNVPNYQDFAKQLKSVMPTIPKILISDKLDDDTILSAVNCEAYTLLSKNVSHEELRVAVIMCLNQAKRGDKVEFAKGIYFDEYRQLFFRKNGEPIDLTKLEFGLLKLLLDRRGDITDYDTIKDQVWRGKKMSIFTMRNVINKIRQKTYYDIIKNFSNKGYAIDEPKNR
ncbi:winged helix-turn-helix domain-containing protein [Arcobacter sp. FWKO B]|uniref:winged helix-turn-helix domain-containing protein n=1 Tax=Arcobacter sp. FWKO B TaxID=2593672 RepID=UPI0018A3AC5C|nr:winged helix-turn-helix domain-containing protein [Arcobacter sp. FWKO B]QOG13175.1 response regulator transcription factor [Arcobacter sp. FWKO B]